MTARRAQDETEDRLHDTAQTVGRTAAAAQKSAGRSIEGAETGTQRVGGKIRGAAPTRAPAPRAITALPDAVVDPMTAIRSAWMDWMGQTTCAGTQMSQDLLRQVAEQQRQFAATAMEGWMTTLHLTQAALYPFINRSTDGSTRRSNGR